MPCKVHDLYRFLGGGGREANEQRGEETDTEQRRFMVPEAGALCLVRADLGGPGATLPRDGAETRPLSPSLSVWELSADGAGELRGDISNMTGGCWWRQALTPPGTMPALHRSALTSADPVLPGLGCRWGGRSHLVCAGLAHAL